MHGNDRLCYCIHMTLLEIILMESPSSVDANLDRDFSDKSLSPILNN